MKLNRNGAVIYEGPSQLDGEPIVVILTGITADSGNAKTGAMLQTWILRSDVAPLTALRTGADASICGDCKHRPRITEDGKHVRTCYVSVWQAPRGVFACYKRGRYQRAYDPRSIAALGAGRQVRLGSYGDPAAVPFEVWGALTARAAGFTGYTHQARHATFDPRILSVCMVSADTLADVTAAHAAGGRAFHVRPIGTPVPKGLAQCPAAAEAGRRATCATCMLCGGAAVKARSISIQAHGNGARYVAA